MRFPLGLLIPIGQNQELCCRITLLFPVGIQLENTFLAVCSQQGYILHSISTIDNDRLWKFPVLLWIGFLIRQIIPITICGACQDAKSTCKQQIVSVFFGNGAIDLQTAGKASYVPFCNPLSQSDVGNGSQSGELRPCMSQPRLSGDRLLIRSNLWDPPYSADPTAD